LPATFAKYGCHFVFAAMTVRTKTIRLQIVRAEL
jgi:hypothetical protein